MTSPATLAGLNAFLDQRLLLFEGPPEADAVYDWARMLGTTEAVVWEAIRGKLSTAPANPPAPTWIRRYDDRTVARSINVEPSRPRGFDAVVAAFRQHGHSLKPTKTGFMTRCSLHQDRRASLTINRAPDDARVALLCCHSCKKTTAQLLRPVGLNAADCFPDDLTARAQPMREILAEYRYVTMAGVAVATKVRYRDRFSAKRFAWRVGNRWRLTDAEKLTLPLYRELDLIECATVFLVEGEKAAERLWKAGLPATCAPYGAEIWEPRWTESLRLLGAEHVVILVDNDAPGCAHGELVAAAVRDVQIRAQVVALPGLKTKEDVYDWLDGGGTVEDLQAIIASTPTWTPGLAEQQRIESQRKRWREKKRRQRAKRREGVPLRSSDARDVPLRSQERQDVPPVPLSPLRSISRVTSKEDDSSYSPSDLDPSVKGEEDPVIETSTSLCRETSFVETHRSDDHEGGDDDDDART